MSALRHRHWVVAKHVIRYLRGTISYGLRYASSGGVMLLGYVDVDYGKNIVDRKSTSELFLAWEQL